MPLPFSSVTMMLVSWKLDEHIAASGYHVSPGGPNTLRAGRAIIGYFDIHGEEMPDKKDPYDRTSSQRASRHLDKLLQSDGQRLPVDLSSEQIAKIAWLLNHKYGSTKVAVIRRAIDEAYERAFRTPQGTEATDVELPSSGS